MKQLYPRIESYRCFPRKIDRDGKARTIPIKIQRLWLDYDIDCEPGEEDFRINRTRGYYTICVRRERIVRQYRTDSGVETIEYEILHQSLTREQFAKWLTDVVGVDLAERIMEDF